MVQHVLILVWSLRLKIALSSYVLQLHGQAALYSNQLADAALVRYMLQLFPHFVVQVMKQGLHPHLVRPPATANCGTAPSRFHKATTTQQLSKPPTYFSPYQDTS